MKVNTHKVLACSAAALLSLVLCSCDDAQNSVTLDPGYRLSLSSGQDALPVFEGTLVFSKALEQNNRSGAKTIPAEELSKSEDLYQRVFDVHNDLMANPAVQAVLSGNTSADFSVTKSFLDKIVTQVLTVDFGHFQSREVNGSNVQKSGQCNMTVNVNFLSSYEKTGAGLIFKMHLGSSIVRKVDITIQKGLNEEYLDATIAHELAHAYIESLYPALAHSSRKTGYGFNEGTAISEGAALYIEQLYLISKYKELGLGLFNGIHPSNRTGNRQTSDADKPYGDYLAYFKQVFVTDDGLSGVGAGLLNIDYLQARNNSLCADFINKLGSELQFIKDWPEQYTACYYMNALNNAVTGGHVNFARKEMTVECFVESNQTVSPYSEVLRDELLRVEPVALALNNFACGMQMSAVFSDGDSAPLIVQAVDIISEYSTATKGLCFFKVDSDGMSVNPLTPCKDAMPGLLESARIACAQPSSFDLVTEEHLQGLGFKDIPSAIVNLRNTSNMRNSTLIHELSHLYMAKLFPMIDDIKVREGYAVYMEYCYLKQLFEKQLYEQRSTNISEIAQTWAIDFLRFKYSYNNQSPNQFERLTFFMENFVLINGKVNTTALSELNCEHLNAKLK